MDYQTHRSDALGSGHAVAPKLPGIVTGSPDSGTSHAAVTVHASVTSLAGRDQSRSWGPHTRGESFMDTAKIVDISSAAHVSGVKPLAAQAANNGRALMDAAITAGNAAETAAEGAESVVKA